MGFPKLEYWSGLPFPPPGNLPDPEIEPASPALQVDSLPLVPPGKPTSLLRRESEGQALPGSLGSELEKSDHAFPQQRLSE